MHFFRVLFFYIFFAPSISCYAVEGLVTDVRVSQRENGTITRVIIDITKKLPFNVFVLDDPNRIVIDLPEVGWTLPPRPLPVSIGLLAKLRYGLNKPGNSRLVIDLVDQAIIKRTFINSRNKENSFQVIVDFASFLETQYNIRGKTHKNYLDALRQSSAPLKISKSFNSKKKRVGQKRIYTPIVEASKYKGVFSKQVETKVIYNLAPRKPGVRPKRNKRVIVLDPGHGGGDPGAIGKSGIYEKQIALAMALELSRQLKNSGRYITHLTRDKDVFIRLRDRVKISHSAGADLFISLHADSVKNPRISGPSIYTLSERASDRQAARLAEKENKSDLIMGFDLTPFDANIKNIFIDLTRRESMNQSAILASYLVKGLKQSVKVLRNTHRFAGFAVLKAVDVPSVLIEMGFLSNKSDEMSLRSKRYRKKLSAAIINGIDNYFTTVEEASNY